MICDFCSDPYPTWSFGCASYQVSVLKVRSEGPWLACESCAILIRGEGWRKLAERGCLTPNGRMMVGIIGKADATLQVEQLHAGFRTHATGESHPL
jgi:hypothetical protein